MGFDEDIAILAQAPVLTLLDRDALRLLTFAGDRRSLAAGETLFVRGAPTDGGFVVLSGTLRLEPARPGAAPMTAGPAALIGRHALFAPGTHPTDALAEAPAAVLRIAPGLMARVLREFPGAAAAIHDWLAQDLARLMDGLDAVRAHLLDPPGREGSGRGGPSG